MAKRVLVISLDGATWPILDGLVRQGCMPALDGIMQEGSHGPLQSVLPPVSAPAWSSFMTGKYPDKHGVWDFRNFDPVEKRDYIANASSIRCETIWELLSRHGREVLVLNLPFTYPVSEINGTMVSGFDSPADDESCYHPRALHAELRRKFPNYSAVLPGWTHGDMEGPAANVGFVAQLAAQARGRTAVARHLMSTREWDVAMIHFQETDYVQHRLWREVAALALGYREGDLGSAIWDLYSALDNAIDELRAVAQDHDPNADVLVLSDHGFGPLRGTVHPNNRLLARGLLVRNPPPQTDAKGRGVAGTAARVLRRGAGLCRRSAGVARRMLFPPRGSGRDGPDPCGSEARSQPKSVHQVLKAQAGIEDMWIDWDSTAAVDVTGSLVGLVFVADPSRVQDVKHALTSPCEDDASLFRDVRTQQEAYGRRPEEAGQLMLAVPPEGYTVSRGVDKHGEVKHIARLRGAHRVEGVWAAAGPGFATGQGPEVRIIDLMPTLLCHLGVPVPDDVDGRVRHELLEGVRQAEFERPVMRRASAVLYQPSEREGLEARLRELGYLG